jgi:hypothetical protein
MRALLAAVLVLPSIATAGPQASAEDVLPDCKAELERRGVDFKSVKKDGIAIGVEIHGALGGVQFTAADRTLVIDCSLAVSLDEAGKYLRDLGVEKATFSSAYSKRNVRGTNRPSKHSYGLAVDVHTFQTAALGVLRVDKDYEQGLGDEADCVGRPFTQGGAILKIMQCQLVRSGLFHLVLSPDYDDAHHDHFHLEAKPWSERTGLRGPGPAIH